MDSISFISVWQDSYEREELQVRLQRVLDRLSVISRRAFGEWYLSADTKAEALAVRVYPFGIGAMVESHFAKHGIVGTSIWNGNFASPNVSLVFFTPRIKGRPNRIVMTVGSERELWGELIAPGLLREVLLSLVQEFDADSGAVLPDNFKGAAIGVHGHTRLGWLSFVTTELRPEDLILPSGVSAMAHPGGLSIQVDASVFGSDPAEVSKRAESLGSELVRLGLATRGQDL